MPRECESKRFRKCTNPTTPVTRNEEVYGYRFEKCFSTLFLFHSAAFVKDTDSSINTHC